MRTVPLSLKAVALRLLAQREQSVAELRRKLLRRALADREPAAESIAQSAGEVEAVLGWLRANQYVDEERFAESRVHARSARFGNLRIRNELARHGVELAPEIRAGLAASEMDRATAVWQRKFGQPPADAHAQARQARFLAGRGFSSEVIRRLVRRSGAPDDAPRD